MTTVTRLQALRYALHDNSRTFDGTPVTLLPLQLLDDGASFLPRQRAPIERPLRSLNGRNFQHVYGVQDLADLVVTCEFKGVNSNTGAAVNFGDWETKMEQGFLLQSFFGAAAAATSGAAPTIAAAGHTPSTGVLEVVGTTTSVGEVIAFATTEGFQIGRIAIGGGTTTLTLDHPYAGTPTTAATVYRLAVWTMDDDLTRHVHMFFSAEGEDWRRDYFGCAPMSMSLALPNTGLVQMTSTWSPTSWADVAEGNTAYAAPTAGEPIVMDGSTLYVDGAEYLVSNLSISMDNGTVPRETANRTNGKLGGVCASGKSFVVEGEFEFTTVSSDGATAFPDSLLATLSGTDSQAGDVSTVREVALKVGTGLGRLMYAILPEADFRCSAITSGALTKIRFRAMGTGAVPAVFAVG